MAKQRKIPLELYIHIPFCARKCFYCDFLSFRTLAKTHEAYIRQLLREIRALAPSCRGMLSGMPGIPRGRAGE